MKKQKQSKNNKKLNILWRINKKIQNASNFGFTDSKQQQQQQKKRKAKVRKNDQWSAISEEV